MKKILLNLSFMFMVLGSAAQAAEGEEGVSKSSTPRRNSEEFLDVNASSSSAPVEGSIEKRLDAFEKDFEKRLRTLEKENIALKKSLLWLLPQPVSSQSDYLKMIFRNRLQSQLTGFFGGYKVLSSGVVARAESSFFLGIDLGLDAISCIPTPGVAAAISATVKIAKTAYDNHQEAEDSNLYYVFSSFNEIDKICYFISEAIGFIYEPQIGQLTAHGAEQLADSAARTLKWYIKKHKGKMITPDQLVLVPGKYYRAATKGTSTDPHNYAKVIDTQDGRKWYDINVFMSSGLLRTSKQSYYKGNDNVTYKFIGRGMGKLCYTKAPDQSDIYGYRKVNFAYIREINEYITEANRQFQRQEDIAEQPFEEGIQEEQIASLSGLTIVLSDQEKANMEQDMGQEKEH